MARALPSRARGAVPSRRVTAPPDIWPVSPTRYPVYPCVSPTRYLVYPRVSPTRYGPAPLPPSCHGAARHPRQGRAGPRRRLSHPPSRCPCRSRSRSRPPTSFLSCFPTPTPCVRGGAGLRAEHAESERSRATQTNTPPPSAARREGPQRQGRGRAVVARGEACGGTGGTWGDASRPCLCDAASRLPDAAASTVRDRLRPSKAAGAGPCPAGAGPCLCKERGLEGGFRWGGTTQGVTRGEPHTGDGGETDGSPEPHTGEGGRPVATRHGDCDGHGERGLVGGGAPARLRAGGPPPTPPCPRSK